MFFISNTPKASHQSSPWDQSHHIPAPFNAAPFSALRCRGGKPVSLSVVCQPARFHNQSSTPPTANSINKLYTSLLCLQQHSGYCNATVRTSTLRVALLLHIRTIHKPAGMGFKWIYRPETSLNGLMCPAGREQLPASQTGSVWTTLDWRYLSTTDTNINAVHSE